MAAPALTLNPLQTHYDGPGIILMAEEGATLPTPTVADSKFTNSWDAAWLPVGYTDTGITFDFTTSTTDIESAEELEEIAKVETKRSVSVKFSMMQDNKFNMKVAMNGGTWTVVSGTGATQLSKYSPPILGQGKHFMLGWISTASDEIVIVYKVTQTGSLSMARQKVGTKFVLACDFSVVKPDPAVSTDRWNRYVAGSKFD